MLGSGKEWMVKKYTYILKHEMGIILNGEVKPRRKLVTFPN